MSAVKDFIRLLSGTSLQNVPDYPSEISEAADARAAASRFARGNIALGVDNSFVTSEDLERERKEASQYKFR